jgi:hypothetical protein
MEVVLSDEASSVFDDSLAMSLPDTVHSIDEERWITVGTSSRGRVLVVVHVRAQSDETDEVIRIISARRATKQERRDYTEG